MSTTLNPPVNVLSVLEQPPVLQTVLTQPAPRTTTLSMGQGPSGPPGSAGGQYLPYLAYTDLSGHRVLKTYTATQVGYADSSNTFDASSILGISTGAAVAGDRIDVQFFGTMIEPSWNWVPNRPVFCGPMGVLTQTPPTFGFQCIVGVAIAFDTIIINIKPPIIL